MSTDIDVYQPSGIDQYLAGIVMTPDDAKALDDKLRACTRAVLREGTDYGVIPGTGGDKTLLKPGAEKLLQWFGMAYTMHCLDIERGDDGSKQGVTYRCTVVKRLGDGRTADIATCEGYAGYDEERFYQPAETARFKAEARERKWAEHDGRPANPNKWKHITDYRAPWNTVIKMAQKRALVGATIDATAAAGLFSQEDDAAPPADDGSSWYEQAIEQALTFTDVEAGRALYVEAAQAHRDGLCMRRQQDHIQNTIKKRASLLQSATPADVEDLAQAAANADAGPGRADDEGREPPAGEEPDETDHDTPGTATTPQIGAIWTVLTGVFKFGKDEKDQARAVCAHVIGRPLQSTKDMTRNEARAVLDALASWRETAERDEEQPREFLIELLATAEKAGDGDG